MLRPVLNQITRKLKQFPISNTITEHYAWNSNLPQLPPPNNARKYPVLAALGFLFGLSLYYNKPINIPEVQEISIKNKNKSKKGNQPPTLRESFNFINEVVKKCAPSVVYIEIRDPRRIDPSTGEPLTASNGSGFIIREDGYVLTNAHVVINKPQAIVMVMMQDGSSHQATIEDADMNIDLALLKISTTHPLPTLKLGKSSEVATGEWVVALGSPLSLSHSVTAGVVSSTDRAAEELGLKNYAMHYIQTDAAITFGNSGGPLVNLDGDVIGINNLRITAGISFAIPIDYVKDFLTRSPYTTNISSASNNINEKCIGITTISVTPNIIKHLQEQHQNVPPELKCGILIFKVVNGSPASLGGLVEGDIITHINGLQVREAGDIYILLSNKSIKVLKMDVIREGKKMRVSVKAN